MTPPCSGVYVVNGPLVLLRQYFFSLLLDFQSNHFNISKQPFDLFFLQTWPLFFWTIFILFEIIYKLDFLFLISPFSNLFIYHIWLSLFWLFFFIIILYLIFLIFPFFHLFHLIFIPNLIIVLFIAIFFIHFLISFIF
jgi:hypothetical protein